MSRHHFGVFFLLSLALAGGGIFHSGVTALQLGWPWLDPLVDLLILVPGVFTAFFLAKAALIARQGDGYGRGAEALFGAIAGHLTAAASDLQGWVVLLLALALWVKTVLLSAAFFAAI